VEFYTKINGDFVEFDLGTFDRELVENKLIHIRVKTEDFYLVPEDLEAIAKTFGEYFKALGSDVILTQGCLVDILSFDRPNSSQCIIVKGDQTDQK
jgi:hypothetical protein